MIIRYQSNIGGLLRTPGIHGGVNERKRDPADFWTQERSHLDGGDMGDAPPFRLAKETNHSPRKRLFSLSSGVWTRLSVDGAPRPPLRSLLLATRSPSTFHWHSAIAVFADSSKRLEHTKATCLSQPAPDAWEFPAP